MTDTATPAAPPAPPKPPTVPAHHPRKPHRKGTLYLEREASKLKVRKKRPGR